jgi:hypothetical protein
MPKPIFLIGVPREHNTANDLRLIQNDISNTIKGEYYVLVYSHFKKEIEFKVFYEKDFDEVKYEELKQIVKDAVSPNLKKE